MKTDRLRDKCGVFGIYGVEQAAEYAYLGIHNLQHRGQESCGIVSHSARKFYNHYGMGIVNEVFDNASLRELKGDSAIAHCRYSTKGASTIKNAQPILAETRHGTIAVAHNGEICNFKKLRSRLQKHGAIFQTESDTEVILHAIAAADGNNAEDVIAEALSQASASYSMVFLTKNSMVAARDPYGVRPLVYGKVKGGYVTASETPAIDIIGAEYLGEVLPGEMIVFNKNGIHRRMITASLTPQKCIFEYIYFARPDSFLFGNTETVSAIRKEFGAQLYDEYPVEADVVIPVPDSSVDAALGFSVRSQIPFDFGLIRSHYIGRTFIEPTQSIRDAKVRKKFNVNRSAILGKRVVVVEDSIVRGTTLKNLVRILKEEGAKEVHVRVSSPPYRHSCYLGIDTAVTEELIASKMSVERICEFIGADSLGYLSREGLFKGNAGQGYCTYCFEGIKIIPEGKI